MKRRSLFLLLSLFIIASLTLSACAGATPEPVEPGVEESTEEPMEEPMEAEPTTLTVVQGIEVEDLDAHTTTTTDANTVRNHIYDTLIAWTTNFEYGPGLAESWEVADDGVTYTFHLRQDVSFHDGTPFNAEAVKFNLERVRDMGSAASSTVAMIADIEVVDDYTVMITTDAPFGPFLRHLATTSGSMQSPTAIQENGEDYGISPVGTGPFRFVEWIRGDRIVLERNPDYWGEPAGVDTLIFKPVIEESVRTTVLMTGEADVVARLAPQDIPIIQESSDVEAVKQEANRTIFFYINKSHPAMADVNVRRAMNYAVDKEGIIAAVLDGTGVKADSLLARTSFGYVSPETSYDYDPELAKSLLEEADFDFDQTIVMWAPQGRYVRDKEIAEAVQGQLQAIGMNVELRVWGDLSAYFGSLDLGEYDLAMIGWSATSGDADWAMYRLMHSSLAGAFFNFFYLDDPVVDDLLERGRLSVDQDERLEIYGELQEYERENAFGLILTYQEFITGINKRVNGLIIRPTEELDLTHATVTE